MSSITRKKLARGSRLYTDHVVGPLQSASVALSGNIAPEQMQEPKGTFRVNLHVPCIDSTFWGINSAYEDNRYSIPFVLPPFQQDVDITAGAVRSTPNTYEYSPSAPRFYLDEISFGFDQRDESCVIADRLFDFTAAANAVQDGQMNFADITKLNIKLSLFEHKMTYWDQQEDPANGTKSDKVNVGKEMWGISMSNVVYAGKNHRENPVMIDNLDLEIFPHKSYAFAISAPELSHPGGDNKPSYALSSATISLKIRTDLVSRDTRASDSVQNIPTKHNGAPTNEAVTVVTPAAGSVITADQSGGISQNLSVIDSVFRDKLNAGYTKNAETVPHQNLSAGTPSWWDWELHQVSLEGTGGAGYFAQGKPIFIGKGWSPAWQRNGMTGGAASNTSGAEQFIEVRMRMTDTAANMTASPSTGSTTLFSGYQGHWVYLIGKKALV
jgi:hypothetical protein